MSQLALATTSPAGANATELTTPVCPLSVARSAPDAASHNLTVLSQLEVAISLPSGENASPVMSPVWPRVGLSANGVGSEFFI